MNKLSFGKLQSLLPFFKQDDSKNAMQALRHFEQQKHREGYETYEESMDFDDPDDDNVDPMFGTLTKEQVATLYFENMSKVDAARLKRAEAAKDIILEGGESEGKEGVSPQ